MKEMLKKYWDEFKSGTNLMFKEFVKKETNKKQRANMWTFTRLITPTITASLSILAIITSSIPIFITTAGIAAFGAFTDKLDGASARKNESYSEYGKLLDQITDKSFAGIIGINLLFLNINYIYLLLGELLIAGVNISYKLKYKKLDINSTIIGKVKQVPLFLSLILGYLSTINPTLLLISNISIILTVLFQTATTISYIENNSKSVKELKNKKFNDFIEELDNNEEKYNDKVKSKSIENKNNELKEKKIISRTEQCNNLRKLKEELTTNGVDSNNLDKKIYQKIKND